MSLRLAASVAALSCPQAAAFTSRLHTPTRRLGRRALTSVRGGAAADTSAAAPAAAAAAVEDPHAWLEDVLGEKPLAWVEEQNKKTLAAIGDPLVTETYKRILSILDSKDKIPSVAQIGGGDYAANGMWYNFWQDDEHVQGIWRKTSLESYKSGGPIEWSTVLDLDALPPPTTDTANTWVWHGSSLLDEGTASTWDRAFISLSPGGSDADTAREFDLLKEEFISPEDGGFALEETGKRSIAYRSRDEALVGGGLVDADMTDSGYGRVVRSWKRGTPLSEAKIVFEAEQADIAGAQFSFHDRGLVHEFQMRSVTFYTSKYWYRCLTPERVATVSAADEDTPFKEVPIPEDAEIGTFGSDAMITLRSDWTPPGGTKAYVAGTLLALPMSDVMENNWASALPLFEPTASKSLQSMTTTKDYVVLSVLEDVRTTLSVWKHESRPPTYTANGRVAGESMWTLLEPPPGVDAVAVGEDVTVSNPNRDAASSNSLFLWRDGYLTPDTLELVPDVADLLSGSTNVPLKANPAKYDSEGLTVDQHFATSADGTKIPYFVIRRADIELDGSNPTLVDAYGGFEISMTPSYSASVGAAWLERGGIKVIANIRGGGEYGPAWHQAALKENRYKCYEDMEAVAQDLIDRKISSPPKMACIGGSNGGLMVGNLITRPLSSKLFGAAVCQVPLLDMKVYSKLLAGASWMAEYGDPDVPEQWSYLRRHSPYHLLRHDNLGLPEQDGAECATNDEWSCPKVLFTTSTRDDRVHPGHARKMVRALMEEATPAGKAPIVHYWENTEGGHGGAADNKQRAHMWALTYTFLAQTLGLDGEEPPAPPAPTVDNSDGRGALRSILLDSEYSPRV